MGLTIPVYSGDFRHQHADSFQAVTDEIGAEPFEKADVDEILYEVHGMQQQSVGAMP
jgi:uncharacterized protein YabN with tetrapyrrole methylase and pyrophosphatase domain